MKTLVKWFVKRYVTVSTIKDLVHKANAAIAKKEVSERVAAVTDYSNDAAALAAVYLKAYSDDGKMSDAERAECDAKCDELVDKYLTDAKLEALVEGLFK